MNADGRCAGMRRPGRALADGAVVAAVGRTRELTTRQSRTRADGTFPFLFFELTLIHSLLLTIHRLQMSWPRARRRRGGGGRRADARAYNAAVADEGGRYVSLFVF